MGGAISSLLDISRRSLQNTSQAIQVVGNNVANVNTTGYSVRNVEFVDVTDQNPEASSFGLGANILDVVRSVDQFVNQNQQVTIQDRAKADARDTVLAETQAPFSLDPSNEQIGSALSNFFDSLGDVQANPGDDALRSRLIQSGQELTQSIRDTYDTISAAQRDADNQMRAAVGNVNDITTQIASLNGQISAGTAGTQQNLGLLDQRDQLLRNLSEKISFNTTTDSHGQVSVYLANGFGLVSGTSSKTLTVSDTPSSGPFKSGLDGAALGSIVWDSNPITSPGVDDVDLTKMIAGGSGQIAGLLNVRGLQSTTDQNCFFAVGDLPDMASRVESIAQTLLTTFNNVYRPVKGVPANVVQSATPAGAPPAGPVTQKFGMFNVTNGAIPDVSGIGTKETLADLNASGLPNFASRISFLPTDPSQLALSFDQTPLAATTAFAPGDGGVATNLLALRNTNIVGQLSVGVGNFAGGQTLENQYDTTVSFVGTQKDQSANDLSVAKDKETQIDQLQSSISGVSIDEELTKLINFQRVFQASSRLIKTSDDLLGEILSAVGGG